MADLPDIYSLSAADLSRIIQSSRFGDAPWVYRQQAMTRLKELQSQENVPGTPRSMERAQSFLDRLREKEAREKIKEELTAKSLGEVLTQPQTRAGTPKDSAEDLLSQAMRASFPRPEISAPPPKSPEDTPRADVPPSAGVSSGIPASPLFPEVPKPRDAAERRAAVESAVSKRIGELGEYKEPEKTFLDSPYTAIIQAGLNMLMGGAGKSPLEAIAGGAQAGLKSAQEIGGRQEARAEKAYGRKMERFKAKSEIEKQLADLDLADDRVRAEYSNLEISRAKGVSADQIGRLEASLRSQANRIAERRNEILEGADVTRQRGQDISALRSELERLEQQYEKALDPVRQKQLQRNIDEVRRRLRSMVDGETTSPSIPSAKSQLGKG